VPHMRLRSEITFRTSTWEYLSILSGHREEYALAQRERGRGKPLITGHGAGWHDVRSLGPA